jgi:hypothetical protein
MLVYLTHICALRIKDVLRQGCFCQVKPGRLAERIPSSATTWTAGRIELDFRPDAALFVDLRVNRSQPTVGEIFIYARTVRLSLEANGSLCSALLEQRKYKSNQ